jgi:hypothetical protein
MGDALVVTFQTLSCIVCLISIIGQCEVYAGVQMVGVASTFTGVWVEVAGLNAELDVLAGYADLATKTSAACRHAAPVLLCCTTAPVRSSSVY